MGFLLSHWRSFPCQCVVLENGYPQGEKNSASWCNRSTNRATKNFPCSQARQLSGFWFGRLPTPMMPLSLLNTSSICQRPRYKFKMSSAFMLKRFAVVNRLTYSAYSSVSGRNFFCRLDALVRSFFFESSIASLLFRMAQRRPLISWPSTGERNQTFQSPCPPASRVRR